MLAHNKIYLGYMIQDDKEYTNIQIINQGKELKIKINIEIRYMKIRIWKNKKPQKVIIIF
jgi:hypothetical protein